MSFRRDVRITLPESEGIRLTMADLQRSLEPVSRALEAVLDLHGSVEVAISGPVIEPDVRITCLADGQTWPCNTIDTLCKTAGVTVRAND